MAHVKHLLILWFILTANLASAAEPWRDGLGERNGLVVEVGSRSRLADLVAASGRIGLAVLPSEADAEKARGDWAAKGLLGQLSAVAWQGRIPINDRSALHVVVDAGAIPDCADAEILRVLRPGGSAWIGKGQAWRALTGKTPAEIDDWGQYNYDASASEVSSDRLVGPARGLQWVSGPQTKSKKGVRVSDGVCLSIEMTEGAETESLVARDAWSGLVLWRRDDVVPGSRYAWIAGHGRVFFYPEAMQNEAPARSMVVLDLHTGRDVATLKLAWTLKPGKAPSHETLARSWNNHWFIQGPITQPAVAEGMLVFGLSHQHQVLACDPATGEERWRVPVDGRIDSAPTIYRGLVLAGTRMGSVYALNRDTGELVWRFRAAPRMDTLVADGQIESVWPCFGSVNVDERGVMAVAGRHTDTDGGLWWWRLDPTTGDIRGQGRFGADELKMQTYGGSNPGRTVATGSNTPAVMIGDQFLLAGVHATRNEEGDLTDDNALWPEGSGGERERVFWRVRHQTGILVPGNQGLLHRPGYLGGYKMAAYSLTQGVFYAWNQNTGDFVMLGGANTLQHRGGSGGGTLRRLRRFPEVESRELPLENDPRRTIQRIRGAETLWELPDHKQPWRGTGCSALAVAGDTVLVGFTISNRDRWREREEQANRVRLISMKDGSTLADLPLPSQPVTSGIAVAHGRVYVSCSDGSLCGFGPKADSD